MNRHCIWKLLAVLLLALLPLSAQAETQGRAAYVTVGGAPAYQLPDNKSTQTGCIWYGQLVTETERQEGWSNIVYFTTTGKPMAGWVYAPNISYGAPDTVYRRAIVNNPVPEDRLHLRAKPSRNATSRGKYYNRVVVNLISPIRNGWAEVQVGLANGYMEVKYLILDAEPGISMSAMLEAVVSNPSGQLHLRPGPSNAAHVTSWGLFPNGTPLTVLGIGPVWSHVEMAHPPYMEGYMMTWFLRTVFGEPLRDLVNRNEGVSR